MNESVFVRRQITSLYFAIGIACPFVGCSTSSSENREATLALRETSTLALDAAFSVAHATAIDGQTVALISRDGECQFASRTTFRSCGRLAEEVLGMARSGSGFEYLTQRAIRRVRIDGSDEMIFPVSGGTGFTLDQAVKAGTHWVVGGIRQSDSAYSVSLVLPSGSFDEIAVFPLDSASSASVMMRRPLLSSDGVSVFASYQLPPFSRVAINLVDARQTKLYQPFQAPASDTAEFVPEWRARHTHFLQAGLVQSFADIRSDRRVIVVVPPDRLPSRQTVVDAPIGILAIDTTRRLVVAIRSLGVEELVWYSY